MSLPPVIVTRGQPGANQTADRIRKLDLHPIVSPALSLRLANPIPVIDLDGCVGVIFTSANGVRFFAEVCSDRELPAWCVGPATCEAAKAAGFEITHNADGNSHDLIALIRQQADASAGHLLHIANTAAGDTIKTELRSAGFDVRFAGLYEPVDALALHPAAEEALKNGPACIVIHSAKGAASFAHLVQQMETHPMVFICVSEKAAGPILKLGDVRMAARPNEEELLRVLEDWKLAL